MSEEQKPSIQLTYDIERERKQFIFQLYEKGLISCQTLLKEFAIDYENEINWLKEEKEMFDSLKYDNEGRHYNLQAASTKIEQARRNLEALVKAYGAFGNTTVDEKIVAAAKQNIDIMQEVSNM